MPKKRSAPRRARKPAGPKERPALYTNAPTIPVLHALIVGHENILKNLEAVCNGIGERLQLLENRADASATDIADIRHSVATLEGLARAGQGEAG